MRRFLVVLFVAFPGLTMATEQVDPPCSTIMYAMKNKFVKDYMAPVREALTPILTVIPADYPSILPQLEKFESRISIINSELSTVKKTIANLAVEAKEGWLKQTQKLQKRRQELKLEKERFESKAVPLDERLKNTYQSVLTDTAGDSIWVGPEGRSAQNGYSVFGTHDIELAENHYSQDSPQRRITVRYYFGKDKFYVVDFSEIHSMPVIGSEEGNLYKAMRRRVLKTELCSEDELDWSKEEQAKYLGVSVR